MERGAVTFDDVAVYFTEEEWRTLQEEEKNLYKEVMNENYQMILSLNRPDLITNIELGCDPYITTARAGAIQDSWQDERPAASGRSVFQEDTRSAVSTACVPPLKRQRRYPRVNPFRWIKRHKKSKSRAQRTSRRPEPRENETSLPWGETDQPEEAGDSREGRSALRTEGSSISVQTREEEVEQSVPQTEVGKRTSDGCPRSWTMCIRDTKFKPDLRVTLITSREEEPEGAAGNGERAADLRHHILHTAEAERLALPPDSHNQGIRGEDGPAQSYRDAANPPQSPTKATDDLTGAGRSVHPDDEKPPEKKRMDSACEETKTSPPWRREKRVKFSDTVTTFIIEPEDAERGSDDGMKLRSKSHPRPIIVSSAGEPRNRDEEHMVTKSQDSEPERKTTTVHDTMGGGNQDLKSRTSMRCITMKKKKTEKVQGSPPRAESGTDTAEPPPSTGPRLQPKNRDEEHMVTRSQDSKPNVTQPEGKTTTVRDTMGGGNQHLKSQNSNKKTEEVPGSPPCAESGRVATGPPLSTGPQPKKKDVGTQMDLIHKEENPQTESEIPLTPPPPANTNQSFVKSYSCSNCGKITHWTKLNGQQKADVKKSFLHICKMCRRQSDKNKAALSPHIDRSTQSTTSTKCAESGEAIVARSPARKKPHCSLKADLSIDGPTAKKKQKQEVEDEETSRNPAGHNVQLRKGEEVTQRNPTNHNVQLRKGEESPRTLTNHNVQLKKGEEVTPRNPTNHNVQLRKGEEVTQRNPTNHNVQLKKGEEVTPRNPTNHNVQLRKGEEVTPRNPTNHNVQLRKGEEVTPRNPTNHNVQLKKGEEVTPRNLTNHNVQLRNGEEVTPRNPTNHNVQLKKGEELTQRNPTNHNVQLKKGEEESPRTLTNQIVQLKKGEEVTPRNLTNHNVPLKKGEEESPRTLTNHNVQLKKGEEETPRNPTNHIVQPKNNETLPRNPTNHIVGVKNFGPNKKCSAAQNFLTANKSNLCSQCGLSAAPEDAKLHHQVKAINGTSPKRASANVLSSPERRKSNKILDNEPSFVQEEKLASDPRSNKSTITPQDQKNGVQAKNGVKHGVCTKCGKLLLKGQKTKPLTSIQHKKPVRGGCSPSTGKVQKPATKSDAVRKERVKKLPVDPKEKKSPNTEGPKSPRPPRGSRDRVLCTKCGKRLALHVAPSPDGPSEGGSDENECVVLARKKRKRPLAGMEPFTCKECGKIFTRHFTLLQHRLIHTGERPYACKVCRKTFRDSSYLIVHMRSHTKEKPYSCTECGKCFSQNSALHVHLRTHSDERPFSCKDCGKSFTDRSTYRHHLRIHTGEKPYACSYCGKKFTQQPHMKRHETIHTGERPFGCAQCGKRFIERTKLKKHELIHKKGKD